MSRSNAELGLKDDVTLFQGAADNPYYALFFKAVPAPGSENVPMEVREVDLRPDREVRLHVEIFNPNGTYPMIVTPGGMGDWRMMEATSASASSASATHSWSSPPLAASHASHWAAS